MYLENVSGQLTGPDQYVHPLYFIARMVRAITMGCQRQTDHTKIDAMFIF
jgi:hypothetical protein